MTRARRLQNANYGIPLRIVPWYLARLPRLVAVVVWAVFAVLWLTIAWLVMTLIEILLDTLIIILDVVAEEVVAEILLGIVAALIAPIVTLASSVFIQFDSCGVAFRYGIIERETQLCEDRPYLCKIINS